MEKLSIFDFGVNDKGEYVNLTEEEKLRHDISEKEFRDWLEKHNNPLVRVVSDFFISSIDYEEKTFNELKEDLEWIVYQKVYHYGKMDKGLYIYSLFDGDCWCLVFENEKHIMVNTNYIYSSKELDKYLFGEEEVHCNALSVRCYDLKGNPIHEYGNKEEDIRHRVLMDEWQAHKFGTNRMEEGKKIKEFYEIKFTLPNLIKFWGEADNG